MPQIDAVSHTPTRTRRGFLFTLATAAATATALLVGPSCSTQATAASEAPLIGIASLTADSYVRAVRAAGGVPIVLPNTDGDAQNVAYYLDLLDGLLMPGGADIPPTEWNEQPHPTTKVLADDRYLFEKQMITAWIQQTDKPLLGICLGSQWINVAHGGSLVQDIPSEFKVNHRNTTHGVKLAADSRLAMILGATTFDVNSYHHQAVRNVGEGLRVIAHSDDGIIEGTESTDPDRFLIGVQWHPEKMMPDDQRQAKLLHAFVEAARQYRGAVVPSGAQK